MVLLTHCGLVTPNGDIDMSQNRPQAITWINVELSAHELNP